jgi:hypothetical protein
MKTAIRPTLVAFGMLLVMMGVAGHARAGLVVRMAKETPTSLQVEWGWSPRSISASLLELDDWTAGLLVAGTGPNWSLLYLASDDEGGLFAGVGTFARRAFGDVFEASRSFATATYRYEYSLTFSRGSDLDRTSIVLLASRQPVADGGPVLGPAHPNPEPSTLVMGGTALALLSGAGLFRRRRRAA